MNKSYFIPQDRHRVEVVVGNSRFITTVAVATTVAEAKDFITDIRNEMPDASHHVYAYRIGYEESVIEGMSDDGEPSGTSGPPTLSVLRGSEIGDIILVTTRYFGGTKLGTGGLVRAYILAAQTALESLKTEIKQEKVVVGIDIDYAKFEPVKRLLSSYNAEIDDETFGTQVSIVATLVLEDLNDFTYQLKELTSGRVKPIILSSI